MKILNFSYCYNRTLDTGWRIDTIEFQEVNLFVGKSGSGKSRILKFFFDLGCIIARGRCDDIGIWKVEFENNGEIYKYEIEFSVRDSSRPPDNENVFVSYEKLVRGDEHVILDRTHDSFLYNGSKLPKLADSQSGIFLLKNEEEMSRLHLQFRLFKKREFDGPALSDNRRSQSFNKDFVEKLDVVNNPYAFLQHDYSLSQTLFLLEEKHPDKFKIIKDTYCSIFSDISTIKGQLIPLNNNEVFPLVSFRDSVLGNWVPVTELSSGMLKVLLIITDILTLPPGAIYILDEYENSLGVNAIDFLPDYLLEHGGSKQILITSHHPYIINNIPVKDWILVSRKGLKIRVQGGPELSERYGKSKQEAFVKLLNDPAYLEG